MMSELVPLGGSVGFLQALGAIVAANFDGLAADLHFDRLVVEIAITSSARFLSHDVLRFDEKSRPQAGLVALSESLAIFAQDHGLAEFRGRAAKSLLECGAEMAVAGETQFVAERREIL